MVLTACSLLVTWGRTYKSSLFSTHPSIHPYACLAHYFRTIRVDFMLHGALHHNGETTETRKRLVRGIFNSCHSHCLHFSVPCLLAQLTAPNMVQCWARLHCANAKGKTMVHFNGIVLLRQRSSTQDAGSRREKQTSPILT